MSWIAVGVAAVGATSSYMNNQQKKKQETAQMQANAESMRYSPWTGNKPQMMGRSTGSDMGAIVGGGMQGAMIGSQLSKMGGTPAPGDSGVGSQMSQQPQLQPAQMGAPQAPAPSSMIDTSRLQSPNMPTAAEMQQMQGSGQLAGQGSPWNNMASTQLKKPNMYGQ